MDRQDRPRALIVGAGIGGLASAIALERAGYRSLVLERAPELRELGFALLLAANAMRALRILGVAERIATQAEVGSEGELRTTGGRVLKRMRMDGIRQATGEDAVCALRQTVHGALVDALGAAEIRTQANVRRFEQTASEVTVELESGERIGGAVLIAADGLHSSIRATLHGDPLRPSGLLAYRGVCRASWHLTGTQYLGRGLEAGVARAGGGSVYWYLSHKADAVPPNSDPKQAVLELVRDFDPALRDLVTRTESSDIRRDALFDRRPLTHWGQGRVTLLGDAAHPMLPHAGQGAAQALEDAVVLGRCLAATADIPEALRRYERLRVPRTTQVVQIAKRNAQVTSVKAAWLCALRDWFLAHGPAAMLEKQLVSLANVNLEV